MQLNTSLLLYWMVFQSIEAYTICKVTQNPNKNVFNLNILIKAFIKKKNIKYLSTDPNYL